MKYGVCKGTYNEAQSFGDEYPDEKIKELLLKNAVNSGAKESEVTISILTGAEYAASLAAAITYKEQRAREYPSIGDQLDMIYHDQIDGTTKWKDAVKAVKDKYPKG